MLYNNFCLLRDPNLKKKNEQIRFNFIDRLSNESN